MSGKTSSFIITLLLALGLSVSFSGITASAADSTMSYSAYDAAAGGSALLLSDNTEEVEDPEADKHRAPASTLTEALFDTLLMHGFSFLQSGQTANAYTGLTYTHADAFDGMQIYNGIDVSRYQTSINWDKVRAAGIEFVFVRVGYRGYGAAGKLATDPYFETHITGALDAGLKVGIYFYTEAISTEEAVEEAQFCIEKAAAYDITLPIVYDYETTTVNGEKTGRKYNASLSKEEATAHCQAFCDTIEAAGYTAMVYANKSDLANLIDGATLSETYKIWLANYTTKTSYTGTYEFWQYSSAGEVDGVSGNTDCSYWYTNTVLESSDTFDITPATFSAISAKTYTGSEITPTPKLTLNGQKLTFGTDYRLVYTDNTAIGTATITAIGMGSYSGSKSTTFKIRPQKVTSFAGSSGKKMITLSWDEDSLATGYQIFSKKTYNGKTYTKVKTIKNNAKTKWKNITLKNNREYFYRIRAYTTVDGEKYYSAYTYLTAATLPGSTDAVLKNKAKLYATPDLTGKALATIPKNADITYLGRTYVSSSSIVYHVQYQDGSALCEGYILPTKTIKF